MPHYDPCRDDASTDDSINVHKENANTVATPAASLLHFKEPLRWHLAGVIVYSFAILGIAGWAFSGPLHHSTWSQRVLPTGSVRVDQFYSGIASVAFMIPAASLVSQICAEFGLLHPFSIAHRVPVSAAHLDKMIDVGPFSLLTIWRYSRWRAIMLGLLMVIGATIVPVSSLILTTGTYAPRTQHRAVIGVPTSPPNFLDMSAHMGNADSDPFTPRYDSSDQVLEMITDTYKGYIVSRRMLNNATDLQLGPIATINMTFIQGAKYDGVVSFTWSPQCESAREDIGYSVTEENGEPQVTFTWPDGSTNETGSYRENGGTTLNMWTDSPRTASGIPLGGTTYLAQASLIKDYNSTLPLEEEGITATEQGTWISRVKCRPTMSWKVSSCIAVGDTMSNCTEAPGSNTITLDTVALDALSGYMTAVPWLLYLRNDYATRMTLEPFFVMPTVAYYDRVLGVLAQSIAAITTAGYFGTAEVPAVGGPPKPVYVVRVYVLFILLGLLYLALGLSTADLLYSYVNKLPFRKATFLTIAYAVHGRGVEWDEDCGCVKSRSDLRKSNQAMLRYGIDVQDRFHVGFAEDVRGWGRSVLDDEELQEG